MYSVYFFIYFLIFQNHPLEYKLNSVHRIGTSKRTIVEPESVNSILLDAQPNDEVDQYCAAAHVGLNQSKNALMVIMPIINIY